MNPNKEKSSLVQMVLSELAKEENHLPLLIMGEQHHLDAEGYNEAPSRTFRYSDGLLEVYVWTKSEGDVWVEVGDTAVYTLLSVGDVELTYILNWAKEVLGTLDELKREKLWAYEDEMRNLMSLRERLRPTTIEL